MPISALEKTTQKGTLSLGVSPEAKEVFSAGLPIEEKGQMV
jgi:hypothetical protein